MKGQCMTPEERLKACEEKVVKAGLDKLEALIEKGEAGVFFKKCELRHVEEQVKLAHRLRSLLRPGEEKA